MTPTQTRSALYAAPVHITPRMRFDRATRRLEIEDDGWFLVTDETSWAEALVEQSRAGHDAQIHDLIEEVGVEVEAPYGHRGVYVLPDASVITGRLTVLDEDDAYEIWGDDRVTAPERIALERVREMEGAR